EGRRHWRVGGHGLLLRTLLLGEGLDVTASESLPRHEPRGRRLEWFRTNGEAWRIPTSRPSPSRWRGHLASPRKSPEARSAARHWSRYPRSRERLSPRSGSSSERRRRSSIHPLFGPALGSRKG